MWYTAKEDADTPEAQGMYGLIAEEVAEVDPTLVYWAPDEERPGEERPESVHYLQLAPLLVNVVQQQRERIVQLETRAATLEAEMRELRAAVAALSVAARS